LFAVTLGYLSPYALAIFSRAKAFKSLILLFKYYIIFIFQSGPSVSGATGSGTGSANGSATGTATTSEASVVFSPGPAFRTRSKNLLINKPLA
jgi:hypothetical protein